MSEIKWQEPPPDRRTNRKRPGKWQQFADALRARPGQLAVAAEAVTA